MFQSFDIISRPEQSAPRIKALRLLFSGLNIDAVLVPRTDEYQGEYVPNSAERLSWLTGFTGSAGVALILEKQAIVFVDGRYTTQLETQTDPTLITGGDLIDCPPSAYLIKNGKKGLRLGIDPWLHTQNEVKRLRSAMLDIGGELVLLDKNPIDVIWHDRPLPPMEPVSVQPSEHAGQRAEDKIAEIVETVKQNKASAVVIADPTSVAWLFNIRGCDVAHIPAPLSRAIVKADGSATLFMDPEKVTGHVKNHLRTLAKIKNPEAIKPMLAELALARETIMLDRALVPYAIVQAVEGEGGKWIDAVDPVIHPRALKNSLEQEGMRAAHLQDGAAMVRFLSWLDLQEPASVSEIEAATALETARRDTGIRMQNPLRDISFDTISGSGPNAAIIHYRVTTDTNRNLEAGEMYLVDSGAQYQNGTTDITRTLAVGQVDDEQKKFFTLVLKGMIALSSARFPIGTRGLDLDPLARIALWNAGVDYAHGTGHGVGSYLSVHEGPQRISRLAQPEIKPGMIISNEPGYYRPGAFGVRIENLLLVHEAKPIDGGDKPMLGFETITWCPIDLRLISRKYMTVDEIGWLNIYHAETREKLLPLVKDEYEREWLISATQSVNS